MAERETPTETRAEGASGMQPGRRPGEGPQAGGARAMRERAAPAITLALGRFLEGWQRLESRQRMWFGAAAALALLSVVAIGWYATRTDWRTLYSGLDAEDTREMSSTLSGAGILVHAVDGGTLQVPAESLDKARLLTASKGGPRSGRMGFDLFDKPNWIGSEFEEKVNYQRALEGELEHTIGTLADVESARVNLVLPHDSLFTDQQREAKASVVLKLRHRDLSTESSEAIRNLVAASVDDLRAENVVLVDSTGRQLGKKSASIETAALEQSLADKLIATLEPVAGVGNVHASVDLDYDTATSDEVDETYDPSSVVTLSSQKSDRQANPAPTATGVPGTASNAPNAQPPVYPSSAASVESAKQDSETYAASKKVRHTTEGPGRLRRVNAAVLINYQQIGSGKQARWEPRSVEEMKRLTDLVKAAVGYDATRGDLVSVESLPFDESGLAPAPLGERLLHTAGEAAPLFRYGGLLLCAVVLFLVVIRPVMRQVEAIAVPRSLPAPAGSAPMLASGEVPSLDVPMDQRRLHAQAVYDSVSEHLRKEPQQSTRLLQSWIHTDG
ncbi:flagellar basal-body MS-ring/collar protein FliF [Silvibacterium sp.]|uniref:flagellar basal-body MS-ring/collar protein FliF n=1 Tax=Silvibacterium sp. TaxID=1964179 RepID=UPI0039E2A30F